MDSQTLLSKKKEGYIYIVANSAWPDYYKLGVTHDIKARLRTYQTSSPYRNYEVKYYIQHPDCYVAERKIHEKLRPFATDKKNEWFKVAYLIIKDKVDESLISDEIPIDIYKK